MDKHKIESAIHELRNVAALDEHEKITELAAIERVGDALVRLGPEGLRAVASFLSASLELRS